MRRKIEKIEFDTSFLTGEVNIEKRKIISLAVKTLNPHQKYSLNKLQEWASTIIMVHNSQKSTQRLSLYIQGIGTIAFLEINTSTSKYLRQANLTLEMNKIAKEAGIAKETLVYPNLIEGQEESLSFGAALLADSPLALGVPGSDKNKKILRKAFGNNKVPYFKPDKPLSSVEKIRAVSLESVLTVALVKVVRVAENVVVLSGIGKARFLPYNVLSLIREKPPQKQDNGLLIHNWQYRRVKVLPVGEKKTALSIKRTVQATSERASEMADYFFLL